MKWVSKNFRFLQAAKAGLALAIFVFPWTGGPSLAFSQGLKVDLLDGSNCRLFCDPLKPGLTISRKEPAFLAVAGCMKDMYEIDYENRLLSSCCYYLQQKDENEAGGSYRVFELSSSAVSRGEMRFRQDWGATKKQTLGKLTPGKSGRGLLNLDIPVKFPKVLSSLVGEGGPGLAVSGNYRVMFKVDKSFTGDVAKLRTNNQQGLPGFQTQQEYNMYIAGNVGSKLFVNMKTDKRANQYQQRVDLADRIQIRFKGDEQDLVQSIEAGNTTLALGGSRFAGFSQSVQGLFGLKAQGKLGGVNWTAITSQQKGNSQSKTFKAGAEAATVRIKDRDYLRYIYFDLGRKKAARPHPSGNLSLDSLFSQDEFQPGVDAIVGDPLFYQAVPASTYGGNEAQYPGGDCYVNPLDTSLSSGESYHGKFKYLPPESYKLNRDSFYVRFNNLLNREDIIGVLMQVKRANGTIETYGSIDTSGGSTNAKYVFKLIKGSLVNQDNVTFYYEWKNVYDLRERDIDANGFTVNIYQGDISTATNPNRKDFQGTGSGVRFIRLFGLDRYVNQAGTPGFDDKIDLNQTVVDLERGYIIFPDRYPFYPTSNWIGDTTGNLSIKVSGIYNDSFSVAQAQYYLEIGTKSRRTEFSLGQVNILDGSEDVRLNGTKLIRGQDYQIDYDLGQIKFFNSQVADPNADVQINYEYTPFISAQKKNLFGTRLEYAPSEALKLGTTALYRTEATLDQKPRIGEEPSHALLLDGDFTYTSQSRFITNLVNKLPGVEAAAPSAFQIDGELARSLPNPNVLGKAFIDDFEGSKDFTNLGILREIWTKSSAPAPQFGKTQTNRGRLAWFSPDIKIIDPWMGKGVERFRVKDIFPNRVVHVEDEKMDVLDLRYFPKVDSATQQFDTVSWGGIMRWLPAGLQNQLETKLLDFWIGLEDGRPRPQLHFDLGQISEDINGDDNWQTEDTDPKNGIVSPVEDIGLFPDTVVWGTDIDHINGTIRNSNDPARLSRPDDEDLGHDSQVRFGNNYFSFTIDLAGSDSLAFVAGTPYANNGPRSNERAQLSWREIRIPLKDSTSGNPNYTTIGTPNWNNIEYVRVWMDGVADTTRVIFATLELVGNRWKELGVFDSAGQRDSTAKIGVSVINSQEHPNYRKPPGVDEVLNRISNLREREQSLVMSYENLMPQRTAMIQRTLLGSAEDYSGYKTLKMFVHGDHSANSHSLMFFLRFGSGLVNDTNNYYEYRISPIDSGWEGNQIQMDFDQLTNLKNRLIKQQKAGDSLKSISDGPYFVKGNPSLAAVRWYVMGIRNADSKIITKRGVKIYASIDDPSASGEVWVDELFLTDVRKEAGTAGRLHFSTQLADFGSVNLDYSRVGATFRSLSAGDRSGSLSFNRASSTNEDIGVSGSFQAHKLLPKFLGVTALPISASWRRGRSTPRLQTGSDIVLSKEFQADERSEQISRGFSVSPSLKKETKNWLWNLTFNRMGGSFSYTYNRSTNPFTFLQESRAYSANMSYDLSPRKSLSFKPLKWLPSFWLLKKVEGTQFSPMPATLNVSGAVSRTLSTNILNDAKRTTSGSYVRDFTGNLNSSFRIFPNLSAGFNFSTVRDLSNPENLVYSFNPRKFKLGLEVSRNQNFDAGYTPRLFSFADTRLTFKSNYREAGGLRTYSDGSRRIEAGNTYGTTVTFNLSRFLGQRRATHAEQREQLEKVKKKLEEEAKKKAEKEGKEKKAPTAKADSTKADSSKIVGGFGATDSLRTDSVQTRFSADSVMKAIGDSLAARGVVDTSKSAAAVSDTARKAPPQAKPKPAGDGGVFLLTDAFNLLRRLAARVDPVQFGYTRGNQIGNQVRNRPGLAFQLGLTNELPGGLNSSNNTRSNSDNYTVGSGLALGSGADLNARYSKQVRRSFISSGTTRSESQVFPDLSFTLSGLEKRVGILKKIIPPGSLSSNYQRQTSKTFDVRTGRPNDVSTTKSYNPLVSVSSTFSRGLSSNFSYGKSIQTIRSFVGSTLSENREKTIALTARYSFIAPNGIRFPLLRGIRLASSLNTNLGLRYTRRTTRNPSPNAARRGITSDNSDLSIAPQLSYTFSTQVDGGLTVQWTDHTDHVAKRSTHVRSAQFWVDLKF